MALACTCRSIFTLPLNSSKCSNYQNSAVNPSQFLASKSIFKLKKQALLSNLQIKKLKNRRIRTAPVVFAAQSNLFRALQTAWKIGRDGIEAGTSLVPNSIPRPIARTGVAVAAAVLALFVLKSFISTVFFVVAMMGVIYFTFLVFNKDEGPREDESTTPAEDSLEEARRIMEKYK